MSWTGLFTSSLAPHLQLADLQSLRNTCRDLRKAVDAVSSDSWLQAARHSLPEDHPLCSISSASIPERAAHLAQLHNNLRAGESGRLANSYLRPSSEADLAPTPSHEGTTLIWEAAAQLHLHKLVHASDKPQLQHLASFPTPGPPARSVNASAQWAPDDSAVLLLYSKLTGELPTFNRPPGFQVLHLLDPATQASLLISQTFTRMFGTFSRDSQCVVVSWQPWEDPKQQHWDVYDRQARKVCHLAAPPATYGPRLAFTCKGTVAAAHQRGWRVWDLASGALIATKGLGAQLQTLLDRSNVESAAIAANRTGTRLAFFSSCTSALELFDAVSLEPLGCVHPAAEFTKPISDMAMLDCIAWASSRSWVLLFSDPLTPRKEELEDHAWQLRVLSQQPGGDKYKVVLKRRQQLPGDPAISPDGAFICTYGVKGARLAVHCTSQGT